MSRSELSQRCQRLQRKLAASFEGWHSGRVDRLKEALRELEAPLSSVAWDHDDSARFLHRFALRCIP